MVLAMSGLAVFQLILAAFVSSQVSRAYLNVWYRLGDGRGGDLCDRRLAASGLAGTSAGRQTHGIFDVWNLAVRTLGWLIENSPTFHDLFSMHTLMGKSS